MPARRSVRVAVSSSGRLNGMAVSGVVTHLNVSRIAESGGTLSCKVCISLTRSLIAISEEKSETHPTRHTMASMKMK